ncbi:hypothetical protein UlMin_024413 [Ulmus minor]
MIARKSIHHSPQLGLILCTIALAAALICSSTSANCLENERKALLQFRRGLVDDSMLFSWKNHTDCCHWRGVKCNNQTGHVIVLDLNNSEGDHFLEGKIDVLSLLELQHLNYLDLSFNDFEIFQLPNSIDCLSQLKYLKLSSVNLVGSVPCQLGNLSYLKTLDLSWNFNLKVINLDWLSSLSSLRSLNLSSVDLSKVVSWPQSVSKLPSLLELQLDSCNLPDVSPRLLPLINSTSSLRVLQLNDNNLNSSIISWVVNVSKNLARIELNRNQLKGALSGDFTKLVSLDKLTELDLSYNLFWGPFPDLKNFPSLKYLFLENNQLNGSVPESIGQLSTLELLSLSSNSFRGVLTEAHFTNLSDLQFLDLSYNHLSLSFSSNWIPPFDQLEVLFLSSCDVGPAFPKWIQTLRNLTALEIGEANISDSIPDWFWSLSSSLNTLNLSYNQIHGMLPNLSSLPLLQYIDLSSNNLFGPLPLFPPKTTFLLVSDNSFSGSISSLCAIGLSVLVALDLSNNNLSGELPNCWMQLDHLYSLNLANNHFSGKLPASLGNLSRNELILDLGNNNFSGSILPIWNIFSKMLILNLRKNNFSGEMPSLQSCDSLLFLGLGKNKISGRIPECIGRQNPPTLVVLDLQSNEFYGSIPSSLCNLQALQVLDLSGNSISGFVPKCFSNLTAMSLDNVTISDLHQYPFVSYKKSSPSTNVMWKGIDTEFGVNLKYLRNIDLSSNRLSGEIPESITLLKLNTLNLSRNRLTGSIPDNFNPRSQLESLDLSRNQLSGRIPASLSGLTSINKLDLSYNKLTGRIPSSTQLDGLFADPYIGNEGLCGPALNKSCPGDDDKPDQVPDKTEGDADEDGLLSFGFYVSVAVGFVVGFWGACGSLIFQSSWRYSFFAFMTGINDQIYVTTRVMKARLQRTLGAGCNNLFWGPFPDPRIFPLLKNIVLDNNQLNGSVPESIEQLSTLKQLSLFSNSFRGVLTEAHFANLSRLNYLDLSYNHLSLYLSSNWIPPFDQLEYLSLSYCDVGPAFPTWIQTQRNLAVLHIAKANISDSIPDWLGNLSSSLIYLNLSHNQIHGMLPNLSSLPLRYIDLSSNKLFGPLPLFPPETIYLLISNNSFSGSISSLCASRLSQLLALDLSNNNLSGELPNCWMQFDQLNFLNLANNHFSGKLPASLGNLSNTDLVLDLGNNSFSGSILPIWNIFPKIQILNLRKNNFSGEMPSVSSCDSLLFLDLGNNKISGRIPECIGRQYPPTLEILVLQSNEFYGSIPSSLCNLQALRVLDLSRNNISGFIPQCFINFSAMSSENVSISHVMWKGIDREFGENLKYLRSIDLSSNKLSGEIPESITLSKLQSLNLSRNRLTGRIPENFSPMSNALESLDLSRNQLSGRIPGSFSSLTSLSILDLSYNKLTGRIPSSTQLDGFFADPYFGNEGLCGPALNKSCLGDDDKPDQVPDKTEGDANEGGFLSFGFYVSVAVGFVVGFWGACGSLIFQSSWRYSFFALMTRINDQIYVATRLMKARSQRTLRAGWYVVNS